MAINGFSLIIPGKCEKISAVFAPLYLVDGVVHVHVVSRLSCRRRRRVIVIAPACSQTDSCDRQMLLVRLLAGSGGKTTAELAMISPAGKRYVYTYCWRNDWDRVRLCLEYC